MIIIALKELLAIIITIERRRFQCFGRTAVLIEDQEHMA